MDIKITNIPPITFQSKKFNIVEKSLAKEIYRLAESGETLKSISERLQLPVYKINTLLREYYHCNIKQLKQEIIYKTMSNSLVPMVQSGASVSEMVRKFSFSVHSVRKWIYETYQASIKEIKKDIKRETKIVNHQKTQKEIFEEQFNDYLRQGLSPQEIQNKLHISPTSFKYYMRKFHPFYVSPKEIAEEDRLKKIMELAEDGLSSQQIGAALGLSKNYVYKWVQRKFNMSLPQLRKQLNVKQKRTYKNENAREELKNKMSKYFAEGLGIVEVARMLGLSKIMTIYYKKIFNLKTKKQIAQESLSKIVPVLIKQGYTPRKIAEKVGLSASTITRWLKKNYGKNFSELDKTL